MISTALSSRQELILSSIVEFYIATGQPVGSKILVPALPFSVSSATIRNDMAALVQLGYLEQPHTSAGRVPSDKGLRYYADRLLQTFSPADADVFRIASGVDPFEGDPAVMMDQACAVLSELTGTLAAAAAPRADDAKITGVQIVPTGKRQAMVMVSSSAGRLSTRIARLNDDVSFDLLELFYNVTAANFTGAPLREISRARLQKLAAGLGEKTLELAPLLTAAYDAVEESRRAKIVFRGQSNLLETALADVSPEILSLLDDPDEAEALIESRTPGVSISIGGENGRQCLKNATVVRSVYRVGEGATGAVAVIGPTKMDYARTLPLVKYVSDTLQRLLEDTIKQSQVKG